MTIARTQPEAILGVPTARTSESIQINFEYLFSDLAAIESDVTADIASIIASLGTATTPVAGAVAYSTASVLALSAAGAVGGLLVSGGTGAPTWVPDVATGRVLVSGGVGVAPSYSASPSLTNLTLAGYADFADISSPSSPAASTSRLWSETLSGFSQLHFKGSNGIDYELGRDNIHTVRNTTASTITKGSLVYISGSTGDVPNVALAKADSLTTTPVAGIVVADITTNSFGQVITHGDALGLNTAAFSVGDVLYLSAATAGAATATIPTGANIVQRIGVVIRANAGSGIVAVLIGGEFNPGLTQTFTNKTFGGVVLFSADNTHDIGAAGATRPRDGYFGGTLSFGTHSAIGAETVTGFITITDAGGTSRKLAVVS